MNWGNIIEEAEAKLKESYIMTGFSREVDLPVFMLMAVPCK